MEEKIRRISTHPSVAAGQPTKVDQQQQSGSTCSAHTCPQPMLPAQPPAAQPISTPTQIAGIIDFLLTRVYTVIDLCCKAGDLAIKQTLHILINDSNLGILSSYQPLPHHQRTTLPQDLEPKATAASDASAGHVRLQVTLKKSMGLKDSSFSKSSKKWSKGNKNTVLPSILRKQTTENQNGTFTNEGTLENNSAPKLKLLKNRSQIIRDHARKHPNEGSFATGDVSHKLLYLPSQKSENDDHYINFLRHVKAEKTNSGSHHSTIRGCQTEVIGRDAKKGRSSQEVLQGEVVKGRTTQECASVVEKASETKPSPFSTQYNKEIKPGNQQKGVAKSKMGGKTNALTYETCISVMERELSGNAFSSLRKQVFQKNKLDKHLPRDLADQISVNRQLLSAQNRKKKEDIKLPMIKSNPGWSEGGAYLLGGERQIWQPSENSISELDAGLRRFKKYFILPSVNLRKKGADYEEKEKQNEPSVELYEEAAPENRKKR